VLLEASRWPLSTPSWGVEGRSIAFCRFVPNSSGADAGFSRGHLELVLQDSLDRKQVVWSGPELNLEPDLQSSLPHVQPVWSADGVTLAIPLPGREPRITVVRIDDSKVLLSLANAYCPSWSPDGMKLAFIRPSSRAARVMLVERQGQSFGGPRDVTSTGPYLAHPGWSGDGRSLLVMSERSSVRSHEIDLVRKYLDAPDALRTIPLVPPNALARGTVVRGITIDFDREGEHCVFVVDYAGRDNAIVTALPGERQILRPFNPLDVSQRIGAIAISPDGQSIAARFGSPDNLTPPAVCDWTSDQHTTLLVPDLAAKQFWLARLRGIARDLLSSGLPKVVVDGQPARRPTLLPLPGELASIQQVHARVTRVARLGASLDHLAEPGASSGRDTSSATADLETRLFFSYLAGDYPGAGRTLDALDERVTEPQDRLAALTIKSQILWAQGERTSALSVIDYIQAIQGAEARRVEDTPFGPVMTKEVTPDQAWTNHLAKQAASSDPAKNPADPVQAAEIPEQPFHDTIIPAAPQPFEGRGGDLPLPPGFRRFDGFER
jgi:hypothetical protein